MKVFSLQWKIDFIDIWQIVQYYEYIEWKYTLVSNGIVDVYFCYPSNFLVLSNKLINLPYLGYL